MQLLVSNVMLQQDSESLSGLFLVGVGRSVAINSWVWSSTSKFEVMVFSQIKWWKEQVVTSSWIIYWLIYILVLMYGHKLWVVIKRTRSRIQAVEICFLPTREVWCWPPLTGSCSEFNVTLCGASAIFVTRCVAPHPLSANFFEFFAIVLNLTV